MEATISLHTFGRRNNWFSDRLRELSVASFRPLLLLLGLTVLVASALALVSYRQSLQPAEASVERLASMADLAQGVMTARLRAEHFLSAGDAESFSRGERDLQQAITAIEQASRTSPADYLPLSQLEQASTDYLNTFRSLGSLMLNQTAADTQATIRQRLDTLAATLDEQVYDLLQGSVATAETTLGALPPSITATGIMLLLALAAVFGLSLLLAIRITHHSAHALRQIGQAAEQISAGHYDTRIDLAGERNTDLIRLGSAFNRMAEHLHTALQAESAATRQNQLQLMKLAHQERMTAILEERQRIARELHDSVRQQLFSITLSSGAAINTLERAPVFARTHLEHIQQAGYNAQAEMTALLKELVPVPLQTKRLEDALLAYLNPLCEIHDLKLLWRVNGTNTLTMAQEHALFRAVQEAVSNVVRHSHATLLRVALNFGLTTYIVVEDNGDGFVPSAVPATSTGLSLMRTRLRHVGGRYELQTAPGAGTRLNIFLDLRRGATTPA